MMTRELIAVRPSTPPALAVRTVARRGPGRAEVLVRMRAASVNPIDVKRATGYGRRLLAVKGAARFPLVLGNDVAGFVEEIGAGVSRFRPGQAVFGLLPTDGHGGTHASYVVVPEQYLMAAPADAQAASLATLPYSFTTMWLAVQATGLRADNAAGRRVLVSGASGALGRLSLELLSDWQCEITAICDVGRYGEALMLGASAAIERGSPAVAYLPENYDVVLNFGAWESEPTLIGKLGSASLGYATTVHPLMTNFDRRGWLGGATVNVRERWAGKAAVKARNARARYAWILFRPARAALALLEEGVWQRRFDLPVGVAEPFERADSVFDHVARGGYGRGVLLT